jgi:hypothetical protein
MFELVLQYCALAAQVAGSSGRLAGGNRLPFVKSMTTEGAATTPPELTCGHSG